MDTTTSIIAFIIFIIWIIVLFALLKNLFIAALLSLTMTGLTLYFWWLPAVIIIILGLLMTKKTFNNTPLIGCIILAIIMAMAGKQFTKKMEENKAEESLNIEDLKDLKNFYDKYNDLTEDTYYQDEEEIKNNTSNSWNYTENQLFDDGEMLEYYDPEYILANSDSEYLTMDDLKGFSASDCRLARNELYARYGRKFDSKDLQNYFNSCSWYHGVIEPDDFQESMLNDVEIANRDLIIKYEKKMGY